MRGAWWIAIGLTACDAGEPVARARLTPAAERAQERSKMLKFREQMCRCQDGPCATKISGAMAAWQQVRPRPNGADEETSQGIYTDIGMCMLEAMHGRQDTRIRPATKAEAALAIAKLTDLRDQTCGCHDQACAKSVSDSLAAWQSEVVVKAGSWPTLDDRDQTTFSGLADQLDTCMQQVLLGSPRISGNGSAAMDSHCLDYPLAAGCP